MISRLFGINLTCFLALSSFVKLFPAFSSGLKSDESANEMNERHEGFGQFVVASGNPPEFFDSTKEPLHFLKHLIFRFVVMGKAFSDLILAE